MRYCESEECSGLDPCPACTRIRQAVLINAVRGAGLSKEQAEKFFHAYAESFQNAMDQVKALAEAAGRKRIEEKAAREKAATATSTATANTKKEVKTTGGAKVTPLKERLTEREKMHRNSSYGKSTTSSNGEDKAKEAQETSAATTTTTTENHQQQHREAPKE